MAGKLQNEGVEPFCQIEIFSDNCDMTEFTQTQANRKVRYIFIATLIATLLMLGAGLVRIFKTPVAKPETASSTNRKTSWEINFSPSTSGEFRIKNNLGLPPIQPGEFIRLSENTSNRPSGSVKSSKPTPLEHRVKSGDTLTIIMKGYTNDWRHWEDVANVNSLAAPYRLNLGQKLVLPSVKIIKSRGTVYLNEEIESASESKTRKIFAPPVNPPPLGTFEPPAEKLLITGVIARKVVGFILWLFVLPVIVVVILGITLALAASRRRPWWKLKALLWPIAGAALAESFVSSLLVWGAGYFASSIFVLVVVASLGTSIVGIYSLLGLELGNIEAGLSRRFSFWASGSFAFLSLLAIFSGWLEDALIVMV